MLLVSDSVVISNRVARHYDRIREAVVEHQLSVMTTEAGKVGGHEVDGRRKRGIDCRCVLIPINGERVVVGTQRPVQNAGKSGRRRALQTAPSSLTATYPAGIDQRSGSRIAQA